MDNDPLVSVFLVVRGFADPPKLLHNGLLCDHMAMVAHILRGDVILKSSLLLELKLS